MGQIEVLPGKIVMVYCNVCYSITLEIIHQHLSVFKAQFILKVEFSCTLSLTMSQVLEMSSLLLIFISPLYSVSA